MTANELGRLRQPDYTPEPVVSGDDEGAIRRAARESISGREGFERHVGRKSTLPMPPLEVDPHAVLRLMDAYDALNELASSVEAFWCVPGEHYAPGDEEYPVELGALRACRECMEAGS